MKLSKPVYDSAAKLYSCQVTDGIRFSVRHDVPPETCVDIPSLTQFLITSTKGWFSKPLTPEFLQGKVNTSFCVVGEGKDSPTDTTFEGTLEWAIYELVISKDVFLFRHSLVNRIPDEKISIEFPEDSVEDSNPAQSSQVQESQEEQIAFAEDSSAPLGIGPTRQQHQKTLVLKARSKAARALFHAERLTQQYYEEFGEDTEWEDEQSDAE